MFSTQSDRINPCASSFYSEPSEFFNRLDIDNRRNERITHVSQRREEELMSVEDGGSKQSNWAASQQ
jgi:hypothetical protein